MIAKMILPRLDARTTARAGLRLIGVVVVLTLQVLGITGSAPALAESPANLVFCPGTGGYSGGLPNTWNFSPSSVNVPVIGLGIQPCLLVSPEDHAQPPSPSSLTIPPNVPSPPTIDPTDPLGTVFNLVNAVCSIEPGLCNFLLGAAVGTAVGQAGPDAAIDMLLSGTGTFACGNGTLSGTGSIAPTGGSVATSYSLDWSATFAQGVGAVTGTAKDPSGTVFMLSGVMVVNDGSPNACNDSAGASQVQTALAITP